MKEYKPKHSKPGDKVKSSRIWNKKQRLHNIEKPEKLHCRRCNIETGTERFAHYEGFRKHEFGKGIGKKLDDNLSAFLCQKCTDIMDEKPVDITRYYSNQKNSQQSQIHKEFLEYKHSEEWMYLILKTHLL